MNSPPTFLAATPVLASLDIQRSVAFFSSVLGFTPVHVEQGVYGVVVRDRIGIHFWAFSDAAIPRATSCRVQVAGIAALYEHCKAQGIVHPNAPLEKKPWGSEEFGVLDPDGNLVTFHEDA